jgi:hypothetical protein
MSYIHHDGKAVGVLLHHLKQYAETGVARPAFE